MYIILGDLFLAYNLLTANKDFLNFSLKNICYYKYLKLIIALYIGGSHCYNFFLPFKNSDRMIINLSIRIYFPRSVSSILADNDTDALGNLYDELNNFRCLITNLLEMLGTKQKIFIDRHFSYVQLYRSVIMKCLPFV